VQGGSVGQGDSVGHGGGGGALVGVDVFGPPVGVIGVVEEEFEGDVGGCAVVGNEIGGAVGQGQVQFGQTTCMMVVVF